MRTETLLGTYIPQMLAANIQYKKYTKKNVHYGAQKPFKWCIFLNWWQFISNIHCIGYKLPTFWEYMSIGEDSVRPSGAGLRNVHFLIMHTSIGYKLLTVSFGEYMSAGRFLCRGWWMSHFTWGVVKVGGGECRNLHWGWWMSGVVNVGVVNVAQS